MVEVDTRNVWETQIIFNKIFNKFMKILIKITTSIPDSISSKDVSAIKNFINQIRLERISNFI